MVDTKEHIEFALLSCRAVKIRNVIVNHGSQIHSEHGQLIGSNNYIRKEYKCWVCKSMGFQTFSSEGTSNF